MKANSNNLPLLLIFSQTKVNSARLVVVWFSHPINYAEKFDLVSLVDSSSVTLKFIMVQKR
jgi:hypothetical protein